MSKERHKADACAGFTLLEVLIAMALIGMILGFLSAITAYWLPNWDRGVARLQRNEQLALALERVAADLGAAEFIPSAVDKKRVLFFGSPDAIILVRTVRAPHAPPGLEFVRLTETPFQDGPALVRMRAPFAPFIGDPDSKVQPDFTDPVVLLRAPYRLSFAYAGPDDVWEERWVEAQRLPRRIRITVRDVATDHSLAASTVAPVHAELPMECINAKTLTACAFAPPGDQQPKPGHGSGEL